MKFRPNALLSKFDKRQKLVTAGVIGVALTAFLVFGPEGRAPRDEPAATEDSDITRVVMDLSRGSRAENSWLDTAEDSFREINARLKQLEADRDGLLRQNEALEQVNEDLANAAMENRNNALAAIDAQAQEIERLTEEIASTDNVIPREVPHGVSHGMSREAEDNTGLPTALDAPEGVPGQSTYPSSPFAMSQPGQLPQKLRNQAGFEGGVGAGAPRSALSLISFDLDQPAHPYKKLTDYVPAGSYAPAMVISGVDAGVGVAVQSNPRPVLFRITAPAISASLDGDRQSADLTGCMVTGAAIGDLSSEKVYVRLQKMTCSRSRGQVFEVDVEGYMVGAGKAGVRGLVVSREGDLVQKAFMAGAVSGIGNAVAESLTPIPAPIINTTGTTGVQQGPGVADILKSGTGAGVGMAGSKIADYLIKRAEQYQPVITMQAGTPVELVFMRGVSIRPETVVHNSTGKTTRNTTQ